MPDTPIACTLSEDALTSFSTTAHQHVHVAGANVNSLVDCNRLVGQYFITNAEGLEEGNDGPTRQDRPK
jgi:hypothetical protein